MIQIGWLVSDSLLIPFVKTKIAINVKYCNMAIYCYMLQSNTQYGADLYCYIPILKGDCYIECMLL